MIGPAFMANETLRARLGYRWRSTKIAQAIHRLKVRVAYWRIARAERVLVSAIVDIDRYAIIAPQASALYRAYEAWRLALPDRRA